MQDLDALGNFTASGNAEIIHAWSVHAIRNNYEKAFPVIESFLVHTGRRKFLMPIYSELVKTANGRQRANDIFRKAKSNYHFVAMNSIHKLLQNQSS